MSGTSCCRWCVAVCLVGGLILIPGRALASPPDSSRVRVAKLSSVASHVWSLLSGLWQEAGCVIDPNGAICTPTLSPEVPSLDEGCRLDPDGRCAASQ
jgi:hypothetical protein